MAAHVFAADEQGDHPVDLDRLVRLAEDVLTDEGVDGDAEVSLVFLDEVAMAKLNERFHGGEGATDVLSFPIDEDPPESGRHPDSGGTGPGEPNEPDDVPYLLGDVYVCPAVAARNAPEHAGSYEDELSLLVVHGLLHLLGMDHEEDEEAEEMEGRERAHLSRQRERAAGRPVPVLPPRRRGPWLPPRSASAMTFERLRSGDLPSRRPPGEAEDGDEGDGPA